MARKAWLGFWPVLAGIVVMLGLLLVVVGVGDRFKHPSSPAARRALPVQPQPGLGAGVSSAQVFVEPDDGKLRLTRPIRAAVKTIDLTMYILTDHTLIHDLEYAASQGVRVRIILERAPYGSDASAAQINQSAYNQLRAAEIPVHWSDRRFALTHEKTMIIDGQVAYILTLNYSRSAFISNREIGVVDRTPADVREAAAVFAADWNDVPYVPADPNLLLSPINSRARLLALLRRARTSVAVYAEEVQDRGMEQALEACARRGVAVRLITNTGGSIAAADLARLQAAGVRVRMLSSPYIHAKMVLVDRRWAFVGSENFSAASLDKNRELGVLIDNTQALARLQDIFAQDWAA